MRFDGGDDRVNMGDPADGSLDFGTGDFTAEAWVRATGNNERAVFSKKPTGTNVPYWQATVTDDGSQTGRIRVNVFDGVVARQAYGPAVRVDDAIWHHVVVAFDRDAGITVYVDGHSTFTPGACTGDLSGTGEFHHRQVDRHGDLPRRPRRGRCLRRPALRRARARALHRRRLLGAASATPAASAASATPASVPRQDGGVLPFPLGHRGCGSRCVRHAAPVLQDGDHGGQHEHGVDRRGRGARDDQRGSPRSGREHEARRQAAADRARGPTRTLNGIPDFVDAVNKVSLGGGTCYTCALQGAERSFETARPGSQKVIVLVTERPNTFGSTGFNSSGAPTGYPPMTLSQMAGQFDANTVVRAFAVGPNVTCASDPGGFGSLNVAAAVDARRDVHERGQLRGPRPRARGRGQRLDPCRFRNDSSTRVREGMARARPWPCLAQDVSSVPIACRLIHRGVCSDFSR